MRVRIRIILANSQTIQKIGLLILHVRCDRHRHAAVRNLSERVEIKTLSNERPMFPPESCL